MTAYTGLARIIPLILHTKLGPRSLEEAKLDETYLEWGVVGGQGVKTTDQEQANGTSGEEFIEKISTIPLDSESEPEVMIDTEIPKPRHQNESAPTNESKAQLQPHVLK